MDNELTKRFVLEKSKMDKVFASLRIIRETKEERQFLDMAKNYYNDSDYFHGKGDSIRAFEAIVISWSYVDAGIKMGFFAMPEDFRLYFTS